MKNTSIVSRTRPSVLASPLAAPRQVLRAASRDTVDVRACRNLSELLHRRIQLTPNAPAVWRPQATGGRTKDADGAREVAWDKLSWADVGTEVECLAGGLHWLGFKRGEKFAFSTTTQSASVLLDQAVLGLGGVSTMIYEVLPVDRLVEALGRTRTKYLYMQRSRDVAALLPHLEQLPDLQWIITRENPKEEQIGPGGRVRRIGLISLKRVGEQHRSVWHDRRVRTEPGDDAFLYFTSGTSGSMKPVPHHHAAGLAEIRQLVDVFGDRFSPKDRILSVVPYAHIYGRVEGLVHEAWGFEAVYPDEDYLRRGPLAATVSPSILFSAPLGVKRARTRIEVGIKENKGLKRTLGLAALDFLEQPRGVREGFWRSLQFALFNKLVLPKIRARMGGRLHTMVSAGGLLPAKHAWFFGNLGLRVINAWGLTETFGAVALTQGRPEEIGTVGTMLPESELRFAADGSIEVAGPTVFAGYGESTRERDPEISHPIVDQRWFQTGDTGSRKQGGLAIEGRANEAFKLENGEWVIPGVIESSLLEHPIVEQAVVGGLGRPAAFALIVPNFDIVASRLNDPAFRETAGWTQDRRVIALLEKEVGRVNAGLARHERVQHLILLEEAFTVDNGLLTPSQKVKRRPVLERFAGQIQAAYLRGE